MPDNQNAALLEALKNLVAEFKRVFPIYYYSEPWAHNKNVVLLAAEKALASPAHAEEADLIAAEIERIDRAAIAQKEGES